MILWTNNATAAVAGAIAPTDTQVTVATGLGEKFPAPVAPDYFIATFYKNDGSGRHEIVHVTARAGDTMTLLRAQENTQADQWNPGDTFANLVTAGALNEILQTSEEDVQEAPLTGKPYARELGGWTNSPFGTYVPPQWPPAGWPQTTMVYTGRDVGTVNALSVPSVNPSMAALVEGMLFTVKVMNANTGATTMRVQGSTAYPVVMRDGSPLEAGKLTAGQMMLFWFDGGKFVTPASHIEVKPPPDPTPPPDVYVPPPIEIPLWTDFYVDFNSGNDDHKKHDGLSWEKAWATINAAVNNIERYYLSRPYVKVHCKPIDEDDFGPITIKSSHVAEWHWIGYPDPRTCVISPVSSTEYAFDIENAKVTIEGFGIAGGRGSIVRGGGEVWLKRCNIYGPDPNKVAITVLSGGCLILVDDIHYIPDVRHHVVNCFIEINAGLCWLGKEDHDFACHVFFDDVCQFNYGMCWARNGATVTCHHDGVSFANAKNVTGPKFRCESGSGFDGHKGDLNFYPGDQPGFIDHASFGWYR